MKHLLIASLAALLWTGCGDPKVQCQFNADCVQPQEYCEISSSVCVAYECIKDSDCESTQRCNTQENRCIDKPPKMDMSMDMDMSTNPPDMPKDQTDTQDTTPDVDPNTDKTPPTVVSVEPATGGAPISGRPVFTITFNEKIDPISVSEYSIFLKDSSDTQITLDINYDADKLQATAQPAADLSPASRYTLEIKTFVRDLARNDLDKEYTYNYYTAYSEPAANTALAMKWAPVIYQGIFDPTGTNWRVDIPTSVDFDGDFAAINNAARAKLQGLDYRAKVYFHVTESKTQYFLYYIMYYPTRAFESVQTNMRESFEHDMTGAVFVVDKASDKLLFVEGLRVEETTDTLISFLNKDGSANLPGTQRIKGEFSNAQLIDNTRYPMFIPSGRHEACMWHDRQPRPPLDLCRHPSEDFPLSSNNGVVLKPGMVGQGLDDATMGARFKEMSYELIPFVETFWIRRDDYDATGLFDRGFTYKPKGMRPASDTEDGMYILPAKLRTQDARSWGKTPFRWLEASTENNAGQWLLDPAWTLRQRYGFGQDITWSQDYCYNLFLGVNTRGQAECP